jgi:hypothetical protein
MDRSSPSTLKRIGIVAGFELRRSLAGPFGLLAASMFLVFHTWAIRSSLRWTAGLLAFNPMGSGVLGWLTGLDAATISAAFQDHPPILVAFFMLALVATPGLVLLASCDQLASEIGSRHVRLLLVRTARGPLFWGKALGSLTFVSLLQATVTLVTVTVAIAAGAADGADAILFGARIIASLIVFSMPFVALMALAGVLIPYPALGLAAGLGLQFVVWLMSTLGGIADKNLHHARLAYPTAFRFELVSDRASDLAFAFGHMAALTVVFATAGMLLFRWRDV